MTAVHAHAELELLTLWERARPDSLREYDQIPMLGEDLLSSVKAVAPLLAGRSVAFMGDHDGVSLMLGLLASRGLITSPTHMLLLDFDERLLVSAQHIASAYGFSRFLDTRLYNAFDPLPSDLVGRFDAFYTNPPYGASNEGASVRLFVTRGAELASQPGSKGYVVLPHDSTRAWTEKAGRATQAFLQHHGWRTVSLDPGLHGYHLDDDPGLKSALLTVERTDRRVLVMPWAGRKVEHGEVPHFYGRSQPPPYPRYINVSGQSVLLSQAAS